MSFPAPPSQQRTALDQNQKQIARTLLPTLENLTSFADFLATLTDAQLKGDPYNYDDDTLYALRSFAQQGAAYAAIFGAGGSLSATNAKLLADVTRRSAGPPVYVNQGSL